MKIAFILLVLLLGISGSETEKIMRFPLNGGEITPHRRINFFHGDTAIFVKIRPAADKVVRSCFDGKATAIFKYDTEYTIGVRTDSLFAFYSIVDSVFVQRGQPIKMGDAIGMKIPESENEPFLTYEIYIDKKAVNPRAFLVYEEH